MLTAAPSSKTLLASVVALVLPLAELTLAQAIDNGNFQTVAPAVASVPADSAASGVDLFPYEAVQLTNDVLANLTKLDLRGVENFGFGDTSDSASTKRSATGCKVFPGDADWPSDGEWRLLGYALGGALIKSVPVAAPCFTSWPEYDNDTCTAITSEWETPQFQSSQATGIDWPAFEGISCVPPSLGREGFNCTLGGLPSYVVNVTNVAQIQLAVNFARNRNIRLSVKNKGHDFNAKNVGAGSISIWTHYLQGIEYLGANFQSGSYSGPALKIGAGVEVLQVYEYASALGLDVVGGIARTVGLGGGYIAGGGHSPLASVYGMAADQVIALEVVLPNGTFVSVSESNFPDLYWALRGGGGSTFGVVTSLIIRAYPKLPVATVTYSFGTSTNITSDTYWEAMDAFWATFPGDADAGSYRYWSIVCASESSCTTSLSPHWLNNATVAQLEAHVAPFFAQLNALGVPPQDVVYTQYDGVLDAFLATWPASTEVVGTWHYHTGSRLFPRSNWENATALAAQSAALKITAIEAGMILGYNIKAATNPGVNQINAVNPAWRATLAHIMLGATWDTASNATAIAAANKVLVDRLQTWRDVSPGAGAYMNEADVNEPNWQQAFYGYNYDKLYALKQTYDPWGVLFAQTAVGSEDWYVTGQIPYYPTQNGRMCRVGN